MIRPLIYVAGPLVSKGFIPTNTRRGLVASLQLIQSGVVDAFCPHMSIYSDFLVDVPPDYERWISLDMNVLERCDALLRLPGESPGADREVAFAQAHDIPVFYDLQEVIAWARKELA